MRGGELEEKEKEFCGFKRGGGGFKEGRGC